MSKNKIVFLIGFILLITPFLGFPVSWKNFIFFLFGVILIALSFSAATKRRASARRAKRMKRMSATAETLQQVRASQEEETAVPYAGVADSAKSTDQES